MKAQILTTIPYSYTVIIFILQAFFYFSEKCFWKKKNLTGVKAQKRAVDSVSPYLRWNDSVQDTTD